MILSFVTQCQPLVPNLKQILVKKWHLKEQRPLTERCASSVYKVQLKPWSNGPAIGRKWAQV